MERLPEPDLMEQPDQVLAYAQADFSEPHNQFVELFSARVGAMAGGRVLDLGCGPGDITRRFAAAYPACQIDAVDGSAAMLDAARAATAALPSKTRISYRLAYLPDTDLPARHYATLISNSLLHHLRDPAVLWHSLRQCGAPGATVFVMDLLRPDSPAVARQLVESYASGEPEILRRDFFSSLLAAYRPSEVAQQLAAAGLARLQIEIVSDRHFIVFGHLP